LIEHERAATIKSIPISTAPIGQLNESLAALRAGRFTVAGGCLWRAL